ncbi:hypothetical protein AALP_AAs55088U000100 [Arabis alpina]|uniref:Uncharacterized protein n=1 Tax=Arabis alpina TaxID=50452 RepID=A0A087FYI8_ARAAL|nr:hypothetical protein AALP_AAs55088U000100 [Arabis alpina]
MTLDISTWSQAAKQAKAIAESLKTGDKDVEMTKAAEDVEPARLPKKTSAAGPRGPGATDVPTTDDVSATDDPSQLEDLPPKNLSLDPIVQDIHILMKFDEEHEYGCDKLWIDQIRAYIVDGKLSGNKWAARKLQKQTA